jgi:hypothetical protein
MPLLVHDSSINYLLLVTQRQANFENAGLQLQDSIEAKTGSWGVVKHKWMFIAFGLGLALA